MKELSLKGQSEVTMRQKLSMFLTAILFCWGAVTANNNRSLNPAANSIMFNGSTILALPGVPPGYTALPNGTPSYGSQSATASPLDAVTFTYEGSTLYRDLRAVKVSGNYAFCTMPYGLQIIDISVPSAPVRVSELYIPIGVLRRCWS